MKNLTNKRRVASLALAGVMGASLLVGSLAYFTDRADTNASATAGTVAIEMDAATLAASMKDADGKDIFNPGDMREVNYVLTNTGNKSIDVKETIILTSSVAMDKTAAQAEYELYKAADVELVAGKGYAPKAGAQPLEVRSISDDGLQITYAVPQYTLNGNASFGDDNREIETGIDTDTNAGAYVLVFKGASSNAFQGSTVKLEILAEAKQHRNTSAFDADWSELQSESVTFGGSDVAVVPSAN